MREIRDWRLRTFINLQSPISKMVMMMQKIWAMMWKDARVRFSSRSELLFFLVLPLLFTVILGGAQFGGDGDNRIPVLVVNEDSGEMADELLALLTASKTVRPELVAAAEAETRFGDNEHAALLRIPAGFGERVAAGEPAKLAVLDLIQAPNNTNAIAAQQAIQAAVGSLGQAAAAAQSSVMVAEGERPFTTPTERAAYFAEGLALAQTAVAAAPQRITTTQPEAAAGGFDGAAHQAVGQLLTWVLIPLLGTSGYLAFERAQGTLRRLLVTPTRTATYLLGIVASQLGLGLVQMTILVLFGVYVLRVNWGHSVAGLALMLCLFGLAAVAFGVMLGAFTKTESQANSLSIMMGMALALLGGAWIPLEVFPQGMQTAVHILPTTWAMRGLSDIVLRGQGVADVLLEGSVLLGFAFLFFTIGVWRFRYE